MQCGMRQGPCLDLLKSFDISLKVLWCLWRVGLGGSLLVVLSRSLNDTRLLGFLNFPSFPRQLELEVIRFYKFRNSA
jgi:hypothetical protein